MSVFYRRSLPLLLPIYSLAKLSATDYKLLENIYVGWDQGKQWIVSSSRDNDECFGIVQGFNLGLWWEFNRKEEGGAVKWSFKQENITLLSPWFLQSKEGFTEPLNHFIQISDKKNHLLLPDPLNPLASSIEMEKWVSLESRTESRDVTHAFDSKADSSKVKIQFDYPKIAYLLPAIEGVNELFGQQITSMQEQFLSAVRERYELLPLSRNFLSSSRQRITVYFVHVDFDIVRLLFYADEYALLSGNVRFSVLFLKKNSDGNWEAGDPAPANWKTMKPHRIKYEEADPFGETLEQPKVAPYGWLPHNIGIWPAGVQNPNAAGITFAEFQE